MKKKILIGIISVICLLSMVLAGCSKINVENIDTDVIGVFQDAIKHSVEDYKTYYVRERIDTDPSNLAQNERVEYMLNVQDDDKSINGVDNTKVNFSIKHTKGITEYTDSFIFGNSVSSKIKTKDRKAEDYKWYVFENYKLSNTSPAFTKKSEELNNKEDIYSYVTKHTQEKDKVALANYTMSNILERLKSLTKDDIIMNEKLTQKKGKVSTYAFEVTNETHKYHDKGMLKVLIYTDKGVSRVMQIASVDEKYTLDVMYQGPKIDIPNYNTYSQSDNVITVNSDRPDGLIAAYNIDFDGEYIFAGTINPLELAETEVKKTIKNGKDKDEEVTFTYKFTTVESAVNRSYEFTEVKIRLLAWDKDGNMYELTAADVENEDIQHKEYLDAIFYIKTSNITAKKDLSSMIPMAAAIVAVIALLVALFALFKIKKQNKSLTKQIKAISGEGAEEEEMIIDAEVEESTETNAEEITTDAEAVKAEESNADVATDAEKTE